MRRPSFDSRPRFWTSPVTIFSVKAQEQFVVQIIFTRSSKTDGERNSLTPGDRPARPPEGQERLFKDACAAGSVIEHHVYPALDHSGTVNGSLKDSTPFVKKAFAGEAIAGNCAKTG